MLRFLAGLIGYGTAVLFFDKITARPAVAPDKTAPLPVEPPDPSPTDNKGENPLETPEPIQE
jgi:hypothetical protein